MKKTIVIAMLTAFLCAVVSGAPMCAPGNLQTFIDLGNSGCEAGNIDFSNFTIVPGQALGTPIDPTNVQVSFGGTGANPQLVFTLNQTAGTGELLESFLRFSASGAMYGASISLNGATVTGDGAITGILDVCPGGSFANGSPFGCSTTPASLIAFAIDGSSLLTNSTVLPNANSLDVFVDLTIDGGTAGSATLTSATVGISNVPEPASGMLAAVGLAACLIARVRRRRTAVARRS